MSTSRKQILVEIEFYKEKENARKTFPDLENRIYRPHLIVKGTTTYLGVWFVEGKSVELGEKTIAVIETIYDKVDYSLLHKSNTEFYIAEGANIVGEGKVK